MIHVLDRVNKVSALIILYYLPHYMACYSCSEQDFSKNILFLKA